MEVQDLLHPARIAGINLLLIRRGRLSADVVDSCNCDLEFICFRR